MRSFTYVLPKNPRLYMTKTNAYFLSDGEGSAKFRKIIIKKLS
jgi:hypothetical protein